MPKSKKTREQKIAASQRHQKVAQQQQITYTLPTIPTINKTTTQFTKPATYGYIYTNKDLQKTVIISASLILLELILFFVLHQRLLKLPWTIY